MKRRFAVALLLFAPLLAFGQGKSAPDRETSGTAASQESSFSASLKDFKAHRFLEIRVAAPVFPFLTTHGFTQSLAVGLGDTFGEMFTPYDKDVFKSTTPALATDLNLTIFPPIANSRIGFMLGAALDYWNRKKTEGGSESLSMNFYYTGFHADYGHFVFNEIGTRISLYGEIAIGWMRYADDYDSKNNFGFDFCPFGVQICLEKHFGLYFEMPHLGSRPFMQMGISLGF